MHRSSLHYLRIASIISITCLASTAWSLPFTSDGNWSWWHPHRPPPSPPPPPPQEDFAARNLKTISSIYNLTVYPNMLPIFGADAAGVPAGLFDANVTGRVDPVGEFTNFEDSIEYFFALAPVPQGNALSMAITSFQITEFSSGCAGVAASVVYLFTSIVNPGSPDNGKAMAPLKQVAFWNFDDSGAVLKYDAWIPNLNQWVLTTNNVSSISDLQFQGQSIQSICTVAQERCTGENTQYSSVDECVSVLSGRPYGDYDEVWGDNVVCRSIHLVLTEVRPDVHCPHVGPTGGGKCVDVPYVDQYFPDENLYNDSLGKTFTCPSKDCEK